MHDLFGLPSRGDEWRFALHNAVLAAIVERLVPDDEQAQFFDRALRYLRRDIDTRLFRRELDALAELWGLGKVESEADG